MIQPQDIVSNLVPDQKVRVISVRPMGASFAIAGIGLTDERVISIIKSEQQLKQVVVEGQQGQITFAGDPVKFKLWIESKRIQTAFQFDPLFAVNCSIVDPLPHQVEAVYHYLLPLPNIRFLLADDTGAGKTIMTGLLLKEMMSRQQIRRVLIITPGGLTKQWQEDELQGKFNLDFTLVDRARFRSEPNVFAQAERVVTSIDFIRAEDVLNTIDGLGWDMVVVDECHKLSKFDYGARQTETKRYAAVKAIADKTEHMLLLTATPHRGRRDTFRHLLALLDPDIFATDALVEERINELSHSGTNRFFIRRLKESMVDWNRKPLFKPRHTETTAYELTPEEKELYDAVTDYLSKKREEADRNKNTHVTLTLLVMQRRLTSSLYAIDKTLYNRYEALTKVLELVRANPALLKQRHRLESVLDIEEADTEDLEEHIRADLNAIAEDPRQLRYFTTATSLEDLEEELDDVERLHRMSRALTSRQHEEAKLVKLKELLAEKILKDDLGGKLVLFTEHRDTLDYLEGYLTGHGYKVATIHGSKSVDERREAQRLFRRDADILLATDAAGEGINLQFCRLLINWDIPWNPNRLEQRMGRIHRYGQEHEVFVFNLVAHNTREGQVLERLLKKLDVIRDQMGSDKVYDVISDVFEEVSMEKILSHFLLGESDDEVARVIDDRLTADNARLLIEAQEKRMGHSEVMYEKARALKEASDEQRLQPRYVEAFFKQAMNALGGVVEEVESVIFQVKVMPSQVQQELRTAFSITETYSQHHICFDKRVFLEYTARERYDGLEFINPGNKLFDALCRVVQRECQSDVLKGARFVDPEATQGYLAWVVESIITDGRGSRSLADAEVRVIHDQEGQRTLHSPSSLVDLRPPVEYAKESEVSSEVNAAEIEQYAYEHITQPQLASTQKRLAEDVGQRRFQLIESFQEQELWLMGEVSKLQSKLLSSNPGRAPEKISKLQDQLAKLEEVREQRLQLLQQQMELTPQVPEVLGCAHVVALSEQEYQSRFGMQRDDEVELIAMDVAMSFERAEGRNPEDVSATRGLGYDVMSQDPATGVKRYIEVKGRAGTGDVMISENEWNRLGQLGETAWLYVVTECRGAGEPRLTIVQDPANTLMARELSRGVQHLVSHREWKKHSNE